MEAVGSSVRVFDGTTDFRVWRARVENELMRYHLLGYVVVRGYDGSQTFTYNGEEVPPKSPVIHLDDSLTLQQQQQQLQPFVKDELGFGNANRNGGRPAGLSRWDVLAESAEAKSILQRFLHPDVECAILNKNVYDSWAMLCAMYGDRGGAGAHDVYEMHRVLHHMRMGDKKGESAREFVTRWEMVAQQYALVTGIELTDGFRSAMLAQTLPSSWRKTVTSWRGNQPFVPYAELVEKVVSERERIQAHGETENEPKKAPAKAAGKPVQMAANAADKAEIAAKPSKPVPPPIVVATEGNGTVDLTVGDPSSTTASSVTSKITSSTRSLEAKKKSPRETADKADRPRAEKRLGESAKHEKRDKCEAPSRCENPQPDKYAPPDRYDKSPRQEKYVHDNRYDKAPVKYETYPRYDNGKKGGPLSCFYCLKVGHHFSRCWYLNSGIENNMTHDHRKRYSCKVTMDRSAWMVEQLEAYIKEEERARGLHRPPPSPQAQRERAYDGRSQQQQYIPPPPPGLPPTHAFRDHEADVAVQSDYRKRSRSVFQSAEGRMSPRDPRPMRSRSVYRNDSDASEGFPPRKRSRTPSFERQLRSQPYPGNFR
ncbi:hypothetical protein BBJ28_00009372 [Nothophytophthora sp. Chile5]|nr:hypothetical protein BBJ28_00009372 [Nothophytophthora sp. Chile5]